MKITISVLALTLSASLFAKNYKPYTIGTVTDKSIKKIQPEIEKNLKENGFKVVGSYSPAEDENRFVTVVTSKDLFDAIKKEGGDAGFAASFRIGFTTDPETKKTTVSYMTPYYWGIAYFGDDFNEVSTYYDNLDKAIRKVFAGYADFKGETFGSKKGLSEKKLEDYQYMWGMPEFDDTIELREFKSYKEAVTTIDANLKKGVKNLELVYAIEIPGSELKLYGIAMKGDKGEKSFLSTIDYAKQKHTAFLPYEILVDEEEVEMLHGKYRIALSFPDLSMGTFTKIIFTPGNIEDLLKSATK
jgi:uncharacterized protein (DUF302 family)